GGGAGGESWRRFCGAAGTVELATGRRFANARGGVRGGDALVPLVKAVIKQRSRDEWLKLLDDGGVPCGAIRTVAEVCDSEVLRARGMIAEMLHPSAGNVKGIKSAIHLSETVLDTYAPPPKLGENTDEVLFGLLGYSSDEVNALRRESVV